jgi:hypothetical protein
MRALLRAALQSRCAPTQEAEARARRQEEADTTAAIEAYHRDEERRLVETRKAQAALRGTLAAQVGAARSAQAQAAAQVRCAGK